MAMNLIQRLFGRRDDRGEARRGLLIESMLLMVAADGIVDEAEMARFIKIVVSSPELEGIDEDSVDELVEVAFAKIKDQGLAKRLEAIAQGLTSREERLAAVRMALLVGSGDGALIDRESMLVEQMRRAFALGRADVEELKRRGAAYLDHVASTNAERIHREALYIETLLLMVAADGVLKPEEMELFGNELATRPEFAMTSPEDVGRHLDTALTHFQRDTVGTRIKAIAEGLADPATRMVAFRLALGMCIADSDADVNERTLLKLLQEAFELSDDDVANEIDAALADRGM